MKLNETYGYNEDFRKRLRNYFFTQIPVVADELFFGPYYHLTTPKNLVLDVMTMGTAYTPHAPQQESEDAPIQRLFFLAVSESGRIVGFRTIRITKDSGVNRYNARGKIATLDGDNEIVMTIELIAKDFLGRLTTYDAPLQFIANNDMYFGLKGLEAPTKASGFSPEDAAKLLKTRRNLQLLWENTYKAMQFVPHGDNEVTSTILRSNNKNSPDITGITDIDIALHIDAKAKQAGLNVQATRETDKPQGAYQNYRRQQYRNEYREALGKICYPEAPELPQ
jgi:hypothetical protein